MNLDFLFTLLFVAAFVAVLFGFDRQLERCISNTRWFWNLRVLSLGLVLQVDGQAEIRVLHFNR